MTSMANYVENKLVDHALGTSAFTMPAVVHLQMHSGAPGEAGTANVATDTSTSADIAFGAASGGAASNTGAITIAAVSATQVITHISLWDGSTGSGTDNCLFTAALAASVSLVSGDDFQIAIGDLDVTFT